MAQECAMCGKTRNVAWTLVKLRGKYNPTVKHKQKPNLQWMHVPGGGRLKVCAKCMKTATKGRSPL